MTPADLETYIRQRYNAVGDSFFAQDEIFNYLWAGQMEVAQETFCIKNTYETDSVDGQRTYDYPAAAFSIRRVEYDGHRIFPNDFIDDDSITGNNADETLTGVPEHYQVWGDQFYLRPAPSEDDITIKLYTYDLPSQPSTAGTLDIPARYHLMLADYALYCMLSKDQNKSLSLDHLNLWISHKKLILQTERLRDSGDSFDVVKDMDDIADDFRFR